MTPFFRQETCGHPHCGRPLDKISRMGVSGGPCQSLALVLVWSPRPQHKPVTANVQRSSNT